MAVAQLVKLIPDNKNVVASLHLLMPSDSLMDYDHIAEEIRKVGHFFTEVLVDSLMGSACTCGEYTVSLSNPKIPHLLQKLLTLMDHL